MLCSKPVYHSTRMDKLQGRKTSACATGKELVILPMKLSLSTEEFSKGAVKGCP